MKKRKILFYGSCQLAVISQYFLKNPELNELFEVITHDESCHPMEAWRNDPSTFAVWSPENRRNQELFKNAVHDKIKQADIFAFQFFDDGFIPELTTKYLCEHISKGMNICIPNTRLYLYCNDIYALVPYIEYAQTKVNNSDDAKELSNFLKISDDPELTKILEQDYPMSAVYRHRRNENAQRAVNDSKTYPHYISMENFIKENYNKKMLSYDFVHMGKDYFIEMLNILFKYLNVDNLEIKKEQIKCPGSFLTPDDPRIDPSELKFFREYFPNVDTSQLKVKNTLDRLIDSYLQEKNKYKNI